MDEVLPRARRVLHHAASVATGATATLDWDQRHRRRVRLTIDQGGEFLLDLDHATVINDGDALELDDGRLVNVRAADEPVCDAFARSPEHMARIAWHLGNRHLSVQIMADRLRIRDDHVIVAMLHDMGVRVERLKAPFTPEGGAYSGHAHDHDH
jgi:urease accessory protein